jgi:putative phosphoribosyl transferase
MPDLPFRDRPQAGQLLSKKLAGYANREDVIVLALPRGGVPVAREIARSLRTPLDVFLVRKLGVPGQEELAMGAIASGGVRILNQDIVQTMGIPAHVIDSVTATEVQELARRERLYRGDRPAPDVMSRTVILVDDGLATGATMRAAVAALRRMKPRRIVIAVPIAAVPTRQEFAREVNDIVCLHTPDPFFSVGFWYDDFSQTTDEDIREMLEFEKV